MRGKTYFGVCRLICVLSAIVSGSFAIKGLMGKVIIDVLFAIWLIGISLAFAIIPELEKREDREK